MRRLVVALVSAATLIACGSAGDTATGSFTIDFPSTAIAIAVLKATPGVQVFAYPTGASDGSASGACATLVEASITNNVTATATATSETVTPCDLMNGKGSLAVGYGSYAFLAVAQTSPGQDFLVGCAEQTISSSNTVVSIPMTLASSTQSIPTTTCATLSSACPSGGSC